MKQRRRTPAQSDIDAAAALVDQTKSVVLFVGYGAHSAKAEVLALAQKLKAPIVHTFRALDLFSFDNPQVIGGLGLIGSKAGYDAVHGCDLLVDRLRHLRPPAPASPRRATPFRAKHQAA